VAHWMSKISDADNRTEPTGYSWCSSSLPCQADGRPKLWEVQNFIYSEVLVGNSVSQHGTQSCDVPFSLGAPDHRTSVSAASASLVSTLIGFPLDSIKSRLQVRRYSGVLDCFRKTFAEEGARGFFRGVWMPLLTITLVRTTSFTSTSQMTGSVSSLHCLISNR
jgi:Mitochondrial carrier protein